MTTPRYCVVCGGAFEPRRGGKPQKYCSAKCREATNVAVRRASRPVRPVRVPPAPRPTTKTIRCEECGLELEVSTRGTPRKFCSHVCAVRASNRRWRRARLPLGSPTTKTCAQCGSQFTAKSRDRVYCYGKWCAQVAYRARVAEGIKLVQPRLVKCDGCGKAFESIRPEARWCSKQCANRHWGNVRARQRGQLSEAKYSDLEIFERDGWRCHLCKKKIKRDLPRLHPEGATIDHLVPTSQGGKDEPANVAAAHWKCNRSKGVTAMNEQLALI